MVALMAVVGWFAALLDVVPWAGRQLGRFRSWMAPKGSNRRRWLDLAVNAVLLPSLLIAGGIAIAEAGVEAWGRAPTPSGVITFVDDVSEFAAHDHQTDIYTIAADGSGRKQVTFSPDAVGCSCAPDGKWIYYSERTEAGQWHLYRARPYDPASKEDLTPELDGDARSPAVSADGNRVAFEHKQGSASQVSILRVATGKTTDVDGQDPEAVNSHPTWSRSGKYLAYVETNHQASRVVVADAKGFSQVGHIYNQTGAEYIGVAFSADDKHVAVTEKSAGGYRVFVADVASVRSSTSSLKGYWLNVEHKDVALCTWSPDGRRLAYLVSDAGEWRVVVQDLRTKKTTMAREGAATAPSWMPDSRRLFAGILNRGCFELGGIDAATGEITFSASTARWLSLPVASDTGSLLAYEASTWSDPDNAWRVTVFVRSSDGTREIKPDGLDAVDCGGPSLSSDGGVLAYHEYDTKNSTSRVRSITGGGTPTIVAGGAQWYARPDVAPDGRSIVCQSKASGVDSVASIDLASGAGRELTSNDDRAQYAKRSKDGRYLAFVSYRSGHMQVRDSTRRSLKDVYVKDLWFGGATSRLVIPDASDSDIASVAWSPDSTSLMVEGINWDEDGTPRHDLYVAVLRHPWIPGTGDVTVDRSYWLTKGQGACWISKPLETQGVATLD